MASRKMLLWQIYLYLVCLVAAITFIIVAGNGLWGVVGMAWPRLTVNEREFKTIASFEHYRRDRPELTRERPTRVVGEEQPRPQEIVDETELRRRWEDEKQLILDAERRSGMREFIRTWVWLIIVIPVYFFHWRSARNVREEEDTEKPAAN